MKVVAGVEKTGSACEWMDGGLVGFEKAGPASERIDGVLVQIQRLGTLWSWGQA